VLSARYYLQPKKTIHYLSIAVVLGTRRKYLTVFEILIIYYRSFTEIMFCVEHRKMHFK